MTIYLTPNKIEAILETIIFYRNTISNLNDEKERDDYRNAGWYLMNISAAEDKITELEKLLQKGIFV